MIDLLDVLLYVKEGKSEVLLFFIARFGRKLSLQRVSVLNSLNIDFLTIEITLFVVEALISQKR